jgi:8-oxo-dGTP pyrophosphatase MutT (NUDIX family)
MPPADDGSRHHSPMTAPMPDYFLSPQPQLRPGHAACAVIVLDDGRYLLQLRDLKPGIFYPGHWGLFGGAIDGDETPEAALRRELREEIGFVAEELRPLTQFSFTCGRHGRIDRYFYEVTIADDVLPELELREGAQMRAFTAAHILTQLRVVPYDSFAIWIHASQVFDERP